jgi:AAHS family benzoate transporter-like MFS transporter
MLVVALCWIAIFSEGYDVGVLGAILPALATDASWKLTPIELGAMGSYTLFGMLIGGL